MDKVYFLKDWTRFSEISEKILSDFFPKNSDITIKMHFGEEGSKTAFFPEDIKPVTDALISFGSKITLLDTPAMYTGARDSPKKYEQVAIKRGYQDIGKILISDSFKDVKTKDMLVEVSKDLVESKNVLVLTHVKGHGCTGFGGAIKNLGMGGVSSKSKKEEHTLGKPKFIKDCAGCGTCEEYCPFEAITMGDDGAEFDLKKCFGCSICVNECPYGCLAVIKTNFDDLLAQGASACINNLPKHTYYINLIKRVTKKCDCLSNSGKIIADDLGILFSTNPVAIDKASIDLVNKAAGKNVFKEENTKDPMLHVKCAEEYTNWKQDYELIELK